MLVSKKEETIQRRCLKKRNFQATYSNANYTISTNPGIKHSSSHAMQALIERGERSTLPNCLRQVMGMLVAENTETNRRFQARPTYRAK